MDEDNTTNENTFFDAIINGDNAVKALREYHGYTQSELADACELTLDDIEGIENGGAISSNLLPLLAEVLGIDPEFITNPNHYANSLDRNKLEILSAEEMSKLYEEARNTHQTIETRIAAYNKFCMSYQRAIGNLVDQMMKNPEAFNQLRAALIFGNRETAEETHKRIMTPYTQAFNAFKATDLEDVDSIRNLAATGEDLYGVPKHALGLVFEDIKSIAGTPSDWDDDTAHDKGVSIEESIQLFVQSEKERIQWLRDNPITQEELELLDLYATEQEDSPLTAEEVEQKLNTFVSWVQSTDGKKFIKDTQELADYNLGGAYNDSDIRDRIYSLRRRSQTASASP